MNYEIERKFLLKSGFSLKDLTNNYIEQKIKQGYLSSHSNLRVRIIKMGAREEAILTLKRGKGLKREEYEENISLEMARELMKDSIILVEKTRYKYNYKNKIWDIDYFPDHDMWISEIELEHEDEEFEKMDFLESEITGTSKYTNKKLGKRLKK